MVFSTPRFFVQNAELCSLEIDEENASLVEIGVTKLRSYQGARPM